MFGDHLASHKYLSVVIPAYNEAKRLPSHLSAVLFYLKDRHPSFEIIVVDDGSSDGTARVVEEMTDAADNVRLIRLPMNRGKGHAVKTGMLAARGALRLFTDADGATPITELERLLGPIRAGASV